MTTPPTRIDSFDPRIFLAKVEAGKTLKTFQKNQIIFEQGDEADTIFYIWEGRIKMTVQSEQGKEAVVGIVGAGQFFGEGCLHGRPIRVATTTAMEACAITAITKQAMFTMLRSEPDFSRLFMSFLLSRNGRIQEDLIDHLFNSSEKRLARVLLLMANFDMPSAAPIEASVSQETLAEMIGTTRSRVNLFMNKFRKLGFVDYAANGKIEIRPSLLTALLLEKPNDPNVR
jgi:CRP-like cAMP-binding protein